MNRSAQLLLITPCSGKLVLNTVQKEKNANIKTNNTCFIKYETLQNNAWNVSLKFWSERRQAQSHTYRGSWHTSHTVGGSVGWGIPPTTHMPGIQRRDPHSLLCVHHDLAPSGMYGGRAPASGWIWATPI